MSSLKIRRFNVKDIKPHRIILLVGKRGTGKSTLIRDLMYHIRKNIHLPFAMTPTEESMEMFRSCMPRCLLYDGSSACTMRRIIEHQRKAGRRKEKQEHLLMVMDDMMYDKKVLKTPEMRDIFMNGRHLKITFVNAMQYVMDMGPDLRSQVDYVFALRENIISNLSRLWKYFFGIFNTYSDFERTFRALTEDNGCIVIDNTVKSNKIEDSVFWYKADINIPSYKLGRSRYWLMSQAYYRTEDQMQEILTYNVDTGNKITHVEKEEEEEVSREE